MSSLPSPSSSHDIAVRYLRRHLWHAFREENAEDALRAYTATRTDFETWVAEEAAQAQQARLEEEAARQQAKQERLKARPVAMRKLVALLQTKGNNKINGRRPAVDSVHSLSNRHEQNDDQSRLLQACLHPSDPFLPDDVKSPSDSYNVDELHSKTTDDARKKKKKKRRNHVLNSGLTFRLGAARSVPADDEGSVESGVDSEPSFQLDTTTTPLHEAARIGSATLVRMMLATGGSPNYRNGKLRTTLHMAAGGLTRAEEEQMRAWRNSNGLSDRRESERNEKEGAGIRAPLTESERTDPSFPIPTMSASTKTAAQAVGRFFNQTRRHPDKKRLVGSEKTNLAINAPKLDVALMDALEAERMDTVLAVMSWCHPEDGSPSAGEGTSVNTVDERERTALHYAAELGRGDVCMTLVSSFGTMLTVVDETSRTPCELAGEQGHHDLSARLEARALLFVDPYGMDDELMASVDAGDTVSNSLNTEERDPSSGRRWRHSRKRLQEPYCLYATWTRGEVQEEREARIFLALDRMRAIIEDRMSYQDASELASRADQTTEVCDRVAASAAIDELDQAPDIGMNASAVNETESTIDENLDDTRGGGFLSALDRGEAQVQNRIVKPETDRCGHHNRGISIESDPEVAPSLDEKRTILNEIEPEKDACADPEVGAPVNSKTYIPDDVESVTDDPEVAPSLDENRTLLNEIEPDKDACVDSEVGASVDAKAYSSNDVESVTDQDRNPKAGLSKDQKQTCLDEVSRQDDTSVNSTAELATDQNRSVLNDVEPEKESVLEQDTSSSTNFELGAPDEIKSEAILSSDTATRISTDQNRSYPSLDTDADILKAHICSNRTKDEFKSETCSSLDTDTSTGISTEQNCTNEIQDIKSKAGPGLQTHTGISTYQNQLNDVKRPSADAEEDTPEIGSIYGPGKEKMSDWRLQACHAEKLLLSYDFDIGAAVTAFRNNLDPEAAMNEVGVSITSYTETDGETTRRCLICFEDFEMRPLEWTDLKNCRHGFCRECLGEYIQQSSISREEGLCVSCPHHQCTSLLAPQELSDLSSGIGVYRTLVEAAIDNFVLSTKDLRFCPHPGCTGVVKRMLPDIVESADIYPDLVDYMGAVCTSCEAMDSFPESDNIPMTYDGVRDFNYTSLSRDSCQPLKAHRFCFSCGAYGAHWPAKCELLERWKSMVSEEIGSEVDIDGKKYEDVAQQLWLKTNTRPCPKCEAPIEKLDGCNHMTCKNRRCKYEFCWICRQDWKLHNTATGGFFRCNKWQEEADHEFYADKPPPLSAEDLEVDVDTANRELRYGTAMHANYITRKKKRDMERLLHHYQRWDAHGESATLEQRMGDTVCSRLAPVVDAAREFLADHHFDFGGRGLSFLHAAFTELVECRSVLRHSYAFAYFRYPPLLTMRDGRLVKLRQREKMTFEQFQADLEIVTEHLSDIVARAHLRATQTQILFLTAGTSEKRQDFSHLMLTILNDEKREENLLKRAQAHASPPHQSQETLTLGNTPRGTPQVVLSQTGQSVVQELFPQTAVRAGLNLPSEAFEENAALWDEHEEHARDSLALDDRDDDRGTSTGANRSSQWACPTCTYENTGGRRCAMCETPRG